MSEFNIQAESVDVERIMDQIRARIREKRGVDYTEEQIREMAGVKLERFVDPKNVRSDLIEHYRQQRRADRDAPPEPLPAVSLFDFDEDTIYRSSRGVAGKVLYAIRRLLRPVLKLFFNPTPIVHALHAQREINEMIMKHMVRVEQIAAKLAARAELDALTYEVLNNLVVEMTRLSLDVKNHRMRVESIAGRLDFDERRARALESVVQYRSGSDALAEVGGASAPSPTGGESPGGAERKRRRRRRGRRRPATTPPAGEVPGSTEPQASGDTDTPSEDTGAAGGSGGTQPRRPAGDASEAGSSSTPSDAASANVDAPGTDASTASETPAPPPAESGGERPPES